MDSHAAPKPPAHPPKPATVVIVDDHPVLVSFLAEVLQRNGRYRVVGTADTAAGAMEICLREKPSLVILDLVLLDSNNLDCLQWLRTELPRTQVLVFSGKLGTTLIGDILLAGASGILGKTATVHEIEAAVERVSQGGMYLCAQACDAVRKIVVDSPPDRERRPELSRRELTVLQHIGSGLSTKQIAARMSLSPNTINAFRRRLMLKTGRRTTAELVLHAARLGLVRVPGLRVATTNPTG